MPNSQIKTEWILFLNAQQKMCCSDLSQKIKELKKLELKKNKTSSDWLKIHQLKGGAGRDSEIIKSQQELNELKIKKSKLVKKNINIEKNKIKRNTHQTKLF